METISGKLNIALSAEDFRRKTAAYEQVWIDLGTGDGRFVLDTARRCRSVLAVGVDSCRENLVRASRSAPANALFVIANALSLPEELHGAACRLTVNFPWGSLLEGLLLPSPALLESLRGSARRGASMEIRLNESALSAAGWELDAGGRQVKSVLEAAGFRVKPAVRLDTAGLKACPSTWARKLAFGSRPRGLYLEAHWSSPAMKLY